MDILKDWEKNYEKVLEKDREAKRKNTLTGRFIKEAFADGFAIYEIIRTNKKENKK